MVDSKQKGTTAELKIRDILRKKTGLPFQRTPLSGGLNAVHGLKSDLYVPNEKNKYAIEVKHYKDDHLDSTVLTGKDPQLILFWKQAVREAEETNKEPLLMFKHDRSKVFVAFKDMPSADYRFIFISVDGHEFYVAQLEIWLDNESPKFI